MSGAQGNWPGRRSKAQDRLRVSPSLGTPRLLRDSFAASLHHPNPHPQARPSELAGDKTLPSFTRRLSPRGLLEACGSHCGSGERFPSAPRERTDLSWVSAEERLGPRAARPLAWPESQQGWDPHKHTGAMTGGGLSALHVRPASVAAAGPGFSSETGVFRPLAALPFLPPAPGTRRASGEGLPSRSHFGRQLIHAAPSRVAAAPATCRSEKHVLVLLAPGRASSICRLRGWPCDPAARRQEMPDGFHANKHCLLFWLCSGPG